MAKKKRFKLIYKQIGFTSTEILLDKETGVNYLFFADGQAGGLTPLLDNEGKVVVTPIPAEEDEE